MRAMPRGASRGGVPRDSPLASIPPLRAACGCPHMDNVPFIQYAGNSIVRNPFSIRDVKAFGFAVTASRQRIQALVDKTLNLAPDTRYRAVSSTVLITYMCMERLTSAVPAEAAHGSSRENELNVSFLLAVEEKLGPAWLPARLAWHMPYLWLDSSAAMIAGRDIYGFPKQYGTVSMPSAMGETAEFSAAGEVIHRFAPGSRAEILPIATARRTDAAPLAVERPFGQIAGATEAFVREVLRITDPLLFIGASLADVTAEHLLNFAFLRQLPRIEDSTRACHQSIAEASSVPLAIRGGGFLSGDFEIEIPRHDSVPWAEEIGLAPGAADVTVKPHSAFMLDFDFELTAGREIWSAP